jgi:hypothetical protein
MAQPCHFHKFRLSDFVLKLHLENYSEAARVGYKSEEQLTRAREKTLFWSFDFSRPSSHFRDTVMPLKTYKNQLKGKDSNEFCWNNKEIPHKQ